MKFVLTILFLFIVSFAFNSNARDLTLKEKTAILNLSKTTRVAEFALSHIDASSLSLTDYLSYKVLKNSCTPLNKQIDKIGQETSEYEDQSARLSTLMNICSHGVISLTDLMIEYNH
ncbi:hypothetical protein [Bacteriovorax sp. Seq25_V]|uniref:hypothetical protein n=1 Tax=Bacteriovorax sp. Seq25_V TaxID=1201288 RepID=UPI000389EB09|nr:hypothetical protein [Bacteriovorax sp. Seq25_V]EQC46347.1 hypothetical protein M900_1078 [Bacteriovorax sp. Seq25_V]